ncbi:hypothetical protein DV736_g6502, partial [Chaetothyriales sp. CBS 134916]
MPRSISTATTSTTTGTSTSTSSSASNTEDNTLRLSVLIDFHEGSFILGSPQGQAPFCTPMARELGVSDPGGGSVVIIVDYNWDRTRNTRLPTKMPKISFGHFSSGSNIALGLTISVQNDPTIHRDWRSVIPQTHPRRIPLVLFYSSSDSLFLPDEQPIPPGFDPPTGFFTRLKI